MYYILAEPLRLDKKHPSHLDGAMLQIDMDRYGATAHF